MLLRSRTGASAVLTPRQRISRGLANTASGPVDLTRGLVGLGVGSARSGVAHLQERYRSGQLARDLGDAADRFADTVADTQEALTREITAAQEVVSGLPQAIQQARRPRRRRRGWLIAGAVGLAVAGGAAAAVIIRGSMRPDEPSPRPPGVDVETRP